MQMMQRQRKQVKMMWQFDENTLVAFPHECVGASAMCVCVVECVHQQ